MFEQFASDFYKDEKRIFNLRSAGQYKNLSTTPYFFKRKGSDRGPRGGKYKRFEGGYKEWKQYYYGFTYPILFASGRLAASLLSRNARDSVSIVKKDRFEIGTSVPYAVYHHSQQPRRRLPRRPIWFFGEQNSQLQLRWDRTTEAYLDKITKGAFR